MKLHKRLFLTKALPTFKQIFPAKLMMEMGKEFLPRGKYVRLVSPVALVDAMLQAIICQLPSQREIVRQSPRLNLRGASSLSYALDRQWLRDMTGEMNDYFNQLCPTFDPERCPHPRILLDTMPIMLQRTQRGNCAKYNNVAKGCGVMCGFNIDAAHDQCVVQIHKIMPGGWNDTYQVRSVDLIPHGPIYIADRGFYSRETTRMWVDQSIHFIMRIKKHNLNFEVLKSLPFDQTRCACVESDKIVLLGKPGSAHRSQVRMIKAWLKNGDDLWLITDQMTMPCEEVLANYKQRNTIEVYHRFIKQSLGLAHLYSYDHTGIVAQVQLIVLLVNLLHISADRSDSRQQIPALLNIAIKQLREQLGLWSPLKRNTVAQRRRKPDHNRRYLKRRLSIIPAGENL